MRLFLPVFSTPIVKIQVRQWEPQKLMFVSPLGLTFCEFLTGRWRWRGLSDFSDEVCSRRFGDTVNEDSQERNFQENVEANAKSKEETFSITEPSSFLILCESNPGEVRFKLEKNRIELAGM